MRLDTNCTFIHLHMTANEAESHLGNTDKLTIEGPNKATIDLMLEVYESVMNGTDVFYCSAPITSGKRYITWLERIGRCFVDIDRVEQDYQESHFREVIEPNRLHAQQIIQRLREQTGCIVVNPTALPPLPGWTQGDWHSFWGKVIERYVTIAFFINDWQYSKGCVYEFWVAQRQGIPTFDEGKCPLSLESGISMVVQAITVMQQRGQSTAFIEIILARLKELLVSLVESTNKPIE